MDAACAVCFQIGRYLCFGLMFSYGRVRIISIHYTHSKAKVPFFATENETFAAGLRNGLGIVTSIAYTQDERDDERAGRDLGARGPSWQ
jgi:hypothetical protein